MTPCQNKDMGEHACSDRSQCFEPCGELGHSAEHAIAAPKALQDAINQLLEHPVDLSESKRQIAQLRARNKDLNEANQKSTELIEASGIVIEQQIKRIEYLEQELKDTDILNQNLADICSAVAIALKGPEDPLQGHDWSDLAECVNILQAGYDGLKKDLERLGRRY